MSTNRTDDLAAPGKGLAASLELVGDRSRHVAAQRLAHLPPSRRISASSKRSELDRDLLRNRREEPDLPRRVDVTEALGAEHQKPAEIGAAAGRHDDRRVERPEHGVVEGSEERSARRGAPALRHQRKPARVRSAPRGDAGPRRPGDGATRGRRPRKAVARLCAVDGAGLAAEQGVDALAEELHQGTGAPAAARARAAAPAMPCSNGGGRGTKACSMRAEGPSAGRGGPRGRRRERERAAGPRRSRGRTCARRDGRRGTSASRAPASAARSSGCR